MGAASLPPNLFLISSKPKFLSKIVSLILFLCELAKLVCGGGGGGRYLILLREILPTYTMGN